MAKAEKTTREYKCIVTGKPIQYNGKGRPPLYCPEVKAERVAAQRKAARNKQAAKRKAAKEAAKLGLAA